MLQGESHPGSSLLIDELPSLGTANRDGGHQEREGSLAYNCEFVSWASLLPGSSYRLADGTVAPSYKEIDVSQLRERWPSKALAYAQREVL
jgi:hypothetical protein